LSFSIDALLLKGWQGKYGPEPLARAVGKYSGYGNVFVLVAQKLRYCKLVVRKWLLGGLLYACEVGILVFQVRILCILLCPFHCTLRL
jgi:hypothetical protein